MTGGRWRRGGFPASLPVSLDARAIAALIPHSGAMCLLDCVTAWSADWIECGAMSHLDPANPLRNDGCLPAVCAIEYALQAAAVHGALRAGAAQPVGFLAALRLTQLAIGPIDDPALGILAVRAGRQHGDTAGLLYTISVSGSAGQPLAAGRATIVLSRP